MDSRIAGIAMFLPCIDGFYDRELWGNGLSDKVWRNRRQPGAASETIKFWPLTDSEAIGRGSSVLSGQYVKDWAKVALKMAKLGGNETFTGHVSLKGFWNDFNCRPVDFLAKIARTPVLWIMATNDIVCGPLEVTKAVFDELKCPKEICLLEGEHLPQYFGEGYVKSMEATLSFLKQYTKMAEPTASE